MSNGEKDVKALKESIIGMFKSIAESLKNIKIRVYTRAVSVPWKKILKIIFILLIIALIILGGLHILTTVIGIARRWIAVSPEVRKAAEDVTKATDKVRKRVTFALACSLDPLSEDCILQELKEESPAEAPTVDQYKLDYGAEFSELEATRSSFNSTTIHPSTATWIFLLKTPKNSTVTFGCDVIESTNILFHCSEIDVAVEPQQVVVNPEETGPIPVACHISGIYYGNLPECVDEDGNPIYPKFYYIVNAYADYEGATASMYNILALRPKTYASLMSRYGFMRDPFDYLKINPDPYLQTYWKGTRGVALVFGYGTEEFGYKPHLLQDSIVGLLKVCITKTENKYYGELVDIKKAVFYISGWIDLCKSFDPSSCGKEPIVYKENGFEISCSRVDIEGSKLWKCEYIPENGSWRKLVALVNSGITGTFGGTYCTFIPFRADEEDLYELYGEEAESFEYAPIKIRGVIEYIYRIYSPDQYIYYISESYLLR